MSKTSKDIKDIQDNQTTNKNLTEAEKEKFRLDEEKKEKLRIATLKEKFDTCLKLEQHILKNDIDAIRSTIAKQKLDINTCMEWISEYKSSSNAIENYGLPTPLVQWYIAARDLNNGVMGFVGLRGKSTPLKLAILFNCNPETIIALIGLGSILDDEQDESPPMVLALLLKRYELFCLLFSHYRFDPMKQDNLFNRNIWTGTGIMHSVFSLALTHYPDLRYFNLLLKSGEKPTFRDFYSMRLAHIPVVTRIQLLLKHGADINLKIINDIIQRKLKIPKSDDLALLKLATDQNPEILDFQEKFTGNTPLHLTMLEAREDIADFFLTKDLNLSLRNKALKTAYELAREKKLLIADRMQSLSFPSLKWLTITKLVNQWIMASDQNFHFFDEAVQIFGKKLLLKALTSQIPGLSVPNALCAALELDCDDFGSLPNGVPKIHIIHLMIKLTENINARNERRDTALSLAVNPDLKNIRFIADQVVLLLLKYKADVNQRNFNGQTMLSEALDNPYSSVPLDLLLNNSEINLRSHSRWPKTCPTLDRAAIYFFNPLYDGVAHSPGHYPQLIHIIRLFNYIQAEINRTVYYLLKWGLPECFVKNHCQELLSEVFEGIAITPEGTKILNEMFKRVEHSQLFWTTGIKSLNQSKSSKSSGNNTELTASHQNHTPLLMSKGAGSLTQAVASQSAASKTTDQKKYMEFKKTKGPG